MILVLRHAPENPLGMFASVLEQLNLPYQYLETYQPEFRNIKAFQQAFESLSPSGLVILGGPQHAMDESLKAEREWLSQLVKTELPIFGICLGSQLLSAVLGGKVYKNKHGEVGWVTIQPTEAGHADSVFQSFCNVSTDAPKQFHWHNDSFALPPGAIRLASSGTCPEQAFRYGKYILAVQFHPEISLDIIEGWLKESKSIAEEEKKNLLQQSQDALNLNLPNSSISHSKALFEAFCKQHFLNYAVM